MKKPKPQIEMQGLKLKAKKPQIIIAALRAWAEASDKVDADPMKLDEAPSWAEQALLEVERVFMASKKLPTTGELDLETLGGFIGRKLALAWSFSGKIPIGPETKTERDGLEKYMASQPKSPERSARAKVLAEDFQNRTEAINQAIPQLMKAVMESSHEDAIKFQTGLLRGMSLEPDECTTARTFQRHTQTFLVLGTGWRLFSKCRSVHEVHRKLCAAIGEDKIGSLKTFEIRVAKKIGMKLGRSGRPSKIK
jgi:hypothetical protein